VQKSREHILRFIDFFHRPFAAWIDQQTFRYLACGGSNQLFNIFIYWFSFNFLLQKSDIVIAGLIITAPVMAYIIASAITIPLGFMFSKYIVFQESKLRGRIQLFRYAVLTGICFLLNYLLIKLFVDTWNFYPTISQTTIIILLAVFSYVVQRFFTFKVTPETISEEVPLTSKS